MHRERETAPGLFQTRRRLLWLTAGTALLGNHAVGDEPVRPASPASAALCWDDFLKECLPTARALFRDGTPRGVDAYLHFVASMAVRVDPGGLPEAKLGPLPGISPPVSFGVGYRGTPFFVVEWRMAPGAFLPPHCHPNFSVCTLGLEGEAVLRNFEIAGEAPPFKSPTGFEVRQTHEELIGPGRVNTLSPSRDNIHTFRAGAKGARGIDLSTPHGPSIGFSFLELGEATGGSNRKARWIEVG